MDEGGDNPSIARLQILAAVEAINDIIGARGIPGGIAPLDGEGLLSTAYLSASALVTKITSADGPGTGLNADMLDDVEGAGYALVDLSRTFEVGASDMLDVQKSTALIGGATLVAQFQHETSGTPTDGFGLQIGFQLEKNGGGLGMAGSIISRWDDAANDHASLDLYAMEGGAFERQLRLRDHHLEFLNVTPTTYPPVGAVWVFAKGGSLYYRTNSTEVGPLASAAGGADHGGLGGLTDDDHSQYLLVTGARAMTGELETGAFSIHATELPEKPSQPGTGEWKLYFKAAGLFIEDDAGVESQVSAGGVSDHGALTGLTPDDDHPHYVLRQPTADVVINDSGGDFNWRMEGTSSTSLWHMDAGFNAVGVGTAPPDGSVRLRVQHTGSDGAIRGDAAGGTGVLGYSQGGSGVYGFNAASGRAGYFRRVATGGTPSVAAVEIHDDDAIYAFRALYVRQDGSGADVARFDSSLGDICEIKAAQFVVNPLKYDYDFVARGDTIDNLWHVDASTDTCAVNGPSTTGRFNVVGGSLDAIYATTTQAGKYAGKFTAGLTAGGVTVTSNSGTALSTNSATGRSAWIIRNTIDNPVTPVLHVDAQSATDAGPVLRIDNAGTGQILDIYDSGTRIFEMIDPVGLGGAITNWRENSSAPSQAATGFWRLYFLDDGLYYRDDAGTAPVGPLSAGGGGGTFIGLSDTPGSYTAQDNRVLTVNTPPNAVEFSDLFYQAGVLAFVGTTSSYPAIKRSTNILEVWLADSSAYTDLGVKELVLHGTATITLKASTSAGTTTYTLPATPDNGKFLQTDAVGILSWQPAAGGTTFLALTDTPADYTGDAYKIVQVGAGSPPTALIFSDVTIDANDTLIFPDAAGARITYYSNTMGVGVETGSLTYWTASGDLHKWKGGCTGDPTTGVEWMRLNVTGLRIGAASDPQRDLHVNAFRIEPGGAPGGQVTGDFYTNSSDKLAYYCNNGTWQHIGNVRGAASTTANAVPRWNGAIGSDLYDSDVLIDGDNEISCTFGGNKTYSLSPGTSVPRVAELLMGSLFELNWKSGQDVDAGIKYAGIALVGDSTLKITDGGSNHGKLEAHEFKLEDSTYFITHKAIASLAANQSYLWPAGPTGSFFEYLRSDGAGNLDWEPLPKWEHTWDAGDFSALETNIAPLEKMTGSNAKILVRAFDYATVEYVNGKFKVPGALVGTGSATVTFRAVWYARVAPTGTDNVVWAFAHIAKATDEDWDNTAYTVEQAGASQADIVQDVLTVTTWTETLTNLGWSADDLVLFRLYRNATDAGDTLDDRADEDDDALLLSFTIEIPVD
jgi:hypothetical protein